MTAMEDRTVESFEEAKRQLSNRRGRRDDGPPPPVDIPPPEEIDWAAAPFECLGVNGDLWWFVDAYHQVIGIKAEKLAGRGPCNVLLGGDRANWAARHFPEYNREGRQTGDFAPRALHKSIAAKMMDATFFDPAMPRRGPGVWGEAGKAIVHTGDAVLLPDGTRRKPSFVRSGTAWISAAAIPAPADGQDGRGEPATAKACAEVEGFFGKWNWDRPHSERMLLGWWAVANLGALANLRPLCVVDAQEGSGKTALLDCIDALSPAAEKTDDTTEAGLRQRMQSRAAPIVLDEFEGTERQEAVLGLLRRMVTGQGSRALRGNGDQVAKATEVVGTAIIGAIAPPVPNAAERSRTLSLKLWPRQQGAAAFDTAQMNAWCEALAPALWGRVLAAWPRIQRNYAVLRPRLLDRGATSRGSEMVAMLVAAREAMVDDADIADSDSADAALAWAEAWVELEADQTHETTAGRCLSHLMGAQVQGKAGETPTVAALLTDAAKARKDSPGVIGHAERVLLEIGLRLAPLPAHGTGKVGLYVASGKRAGLNKLFAGTEWAGGRWATVLAQLRAFRREGGGLVEYRAAVVANRIRFSGENDRASSVCCSRSCCPAPARTRRRSGKPKRMRAWRPGMNNCPAVPLLSRPLSRRKCRNGGALSHAGTDGQPFAAARVCVRVGARLASRKRPVPTVPLSRS